MDGAEVGGTTNITFLLGQRVRKWSMTRTAVNVFPVPVGWCTMMFRCFGEAGPRGVEGGGS